MNGCDFFGHSFDSVYSDEGYWGIRWSGEQEVCQGWITSLIATEGIWNVNVWQVNDAWWRLWACLIELVPLIWFTLVLCIESVAIEIPNNIPITLQMVIMVTGILHKYINSLGGSIGLP